MRERPAYDAADVLLELGPRLARLLTVALEARPHPRLSLRQFRILQRLAENPQRAAELAAFSGVSRPAMSVAVTALEVQGLVHREPDPHDRRAAAVTMTPDGRATYEQAREWLHEILTIVAADLDEHDLRALDRLRDPLNAGMDRARAGLRASR